MDLTTWPANDSICTVAITKESTYDSSEVIRINTNEISSAQRVVQ